MSRSSKPSTDRHSVRAPVNFVSAEKPAIVRIAQDVLPKLLEVLFRRYPAEEWATFATYGWRETPQALILTLTGLDLPRPGDLDEGVGHVALQDQYFRRIARKAESHPFGVGVIHSHPSGFLTTPSTIDDGMDTYFAEFLEGFMPGRPYPSLIFAEDGGVLSGTGRVHLNGRWYTVDRFACEGRRISLCDYSRPSLPTRSREQVARLASVFSDEAAARLREVTIAVVGVSGTGSPVTELLARAGVGQLILVDPETFAPSNLERIHGSNHADIVARGLKVDIGKRHVLAINPESRVVTVQGRLPQPEVIDQLVQADIVLGCTDSHSARVALSDLATRFLVPVIDCGVSMEGADGAVTGQVFQLVRFFPSDPCVYCQDMVNGIRVSQELMSEEEVNRRREEAKEARMRGLDPNPYWLEIPQLNTVGYLTTLVGSLIAGYAIGAQTGRFGMPFTRLQGDLSFPNLGTVEVPSRIGVTCQCVSRRGAADQVLGGPWITPAAHWPTPVISR